MDRRYNEWERGEQARALHLHARLSDPSWYWLIESLQDHRHGAPYHQELGQQNREIAQVSLHGESRTRFLSCK